MSTETVVVEANEVDRRLVEAFERLVPQLSSSSAAPKPEELKELIASPATKLLLACEGAADGPIVGSLTLAMFRIPTGRRAWIEDVVVETSARGRGIGEALTRAALETARQEGARTVDLTSRPSREGANRLYRRIGFAERDTNVYRFDLADT